MNTAIEKVRVSIEAFLDPMIEEKAVVYKDRLALVESFAVTNAASREMADDLLSQVVAEKDALEAVRKSGPGELGAVVRALNAKIKPLSDTLEAIEARLKSQIGCFVSSQRAMETLNYQAAAAAHVSGDHNTAIEKLNVAASAATDADPGTSVRNVWKVLSVDAAELPKEWMIPDEKRLAALARATPANQKPIAVKGVLYVLEPQVTKRRK